MEKTIDIYTDCSGNKSLLSLGIVIIDGEKERTLLHRTSLGVIKEHFKLRLPKGSGGVSVGEIYAIYLALLEIKKLKVNARIYTDCSSSFQLLNDIVVFENHIETRINKPKNRLMAIFLKRCKILLNELKEEGLKIDIRWVPGHANIYGNELADTVAKQCYQYNMLGRFFFE